MTTITTIQEVVANYFQIKGEDMTSKRRYAHVTWPRQIAMFLARKMNPNASLKAIGEAFCRDHGTVMYACQSVKNQIEVNVEEREKVAQLEKLILIETDAQGPQSGGIKLSELKNAIPVVLYFTDAKCADEFIALFKRAKPHCAVMKL